MPKDYYSYIAVVSFDPDGISIEYPDLDGCYSCADNYDEIFKMAKEALGLHLWSMENEGEEIPLPSALPDIPLDENQTAIMVEVFMPPIRERQNTKVVKKTLTIPYWLNVQAESAHINFSQTLQRALKEELKVAN